MPAVKPDSSCCWVLYSALSREVQRGNVKLYTRYEMLDVVLIKDNEGVERARGIIARNLVTGKIERLLPMR